MHRFSQVCAHFGLSISLKKTNIVGRDTGALSVIASAPPSIPTPHWTKLTRGLGRQLQLFLISRLECGQPWFYRRPLSTNLKLSGPHDLLFCMFLICFATSTNSNGSMVLYCARATLPASADREVKTLG